MMGMLYVHFDNVLISMLRFNILFCMYVNKNVLNNSI